MEQNFAHLREVPYANVSSDERTIAILTHVLSLFFPILAPLIIYLVKKDDSRYVGEHAKEALNFGISIFIFCMISIPLCLLIIGVFMLIAIGIGSFILHIIAAVKAADNVLYRYPFSIRLIK
ncbi:hypothetical protein IQ13_1685 [Lacibacter cauensis]|uniref:Tic20 family protein n=1 Tax=Lacibacter cauensis TaxID=510947 RepID=A0A562SR15_9BACT|nr:DUF4870 domain-containing protein [Lacibacter cauensis]TWI83573.1 hypothetical protein IQ13_1685 [Lacibacter cauensis]